MTLTCHPPEPDAANPAERLARLRLSRSQNVGPRSYTELMRRFGSGQRALEVLPQLAMRGGKRGYAPCPLDEAEAEMAAGEAAGATLLLLGDPDYPRLLAEIDTPPPVLWAMGRMEALNEPAIALVGARNASALGLRTARRIAAELSEGGHVIVSGLARGIDAAAHEAALGQGTIAVMAGGIDRIYPAEHGDLARRICETGALICESRPGTEPTARHFPKRNRLISGLSHGVVLIEAAARSGSLITARYALEQGREAMACPGSCEDPRSSGCNALIRDGAALIRDGNDVLEALAAPRARGFAEPEPDFEFDFGESGGGDSFDGLDTFDLEGGEDNAGLPEQILALLGPSPVELDEVARQCGASPSDFSLAILELDLAGKIDVVAGSMVVRAG